MRIHHVGIWTRDLEGLKAFYLQHFNARAGTLYVNARTGFRSYFLSFGGDAAIEIMFRDDVAAGEDAGSGTDEDVRVGYAHLALAVASESEVVEITERLRAAGVPVASAPRRTGDGYFESVVLDPDGNRIEITSEQQ